jgi:hypothetical protein
MRKVKFRVTATVTKIVEVEVDDTGLSEDEVEELAREKVHETFTVENDGTEERYEENSELIVE